MYKIIGADQKEYGLVTADQLRQWVAEGRVNGQTSVKAEGATEWKPLATFPEFAMATVGTLPTLPGIPAPGPMAAEQVRGPAIGLIVVAILGVIVQIASLVFNLVGASFLASSEVPKEAWSNVFYGPIGVVSSIVCILMGGLILFGALQMKKLESYGLAMAASIIAMVPCFSPCCLIGLPIGIWAVVVLSKPEVKSAFH
jgi:hypothetical protein